MRCNFKKKNTEYPRQILLAHIAEKSHFIESNNMYRRLLLSSSISLRSNLMLVPGRYYVGSIVVIDEQRNQALNPER